MKTVLRLLGGLTLLYTTGVMGSSVSVTGGFTTFEGCITDGTTTLYQYINGLYSTGSEVTPSGASCGPSLGFAHVAIPPIDPTLVTPPDPTLGKSSVTFWALGNTSNNISFTPAPPQEVSGPGAPFLVGTLSFTNGSWTADASFGFTLTTVSPDPALNGFTFTDHLILKLTPNDFAAHTPEANADFIYFSGNPLLGSGRAFELQDAPAPLSNTITFDVIGHIGSLHLDAFVNPVGGFLDPSIDFLTVDTTPPVIQPVATGTRSSHGWYRSNIALTWTVTDPDSAVSASQGCGATDIVADTAGQTITCSATSAGGTASVSTTIRRDTRSPSVKIEVPDDDRSYRLNQVVRASFKCLDTLSGVDTCVGTMVAGSALDTRSAGRKSFTVTATDNAGNVRKITTHYQVR